MLKSDHRRKKNAGGFSRILSGSFNSVGKLLGAICGLLCLGLVFLISVDVFFRNLGFAIGGALEISRLTLGWICFCSIVYTYLKGEHVRVTMLVSRLGFRGQATAESISCLLGAVLMFSIFLKSIPFFWEAWKVKEIFNVDIPLPYWLAKLSVPVGTFSFGLLFTLNLIKHLVQVITRRE